MRDGATGDHKIVVYFGPRSAQRVKRGTDAFPDQRVVHEQIIERGGFDAGMDHSVEQSIDEIRLADVEREPPCQGGGTATVCYLQRAATRATAGDDDMRESTLPLE